MGSSAGCLRTTCDSHVRSRSIAASGSQSRWPIGGRPGRLSIRAAVSHQSHRSLAASVERLLAACFLLGSRERRAGGVYSCAPCRLGPGQETSRPDPDMTATAMLTDAPPPPADPAAETADPRGPPSLARRGAP